MENSHKLISKMKKENIKPIPKWQFSVKEKIIGFAILISVIMGGLAFSIILFSIQQLGFDLATHMLHSKIEFLLGLLPFLWIIILLIFLTLGVISIKNSKKGYKFSPSRLFIINSTFSILLGTLFFIGGGAKWLENIFDVKVEFYESVHDKKIKMWTAPTEGYLSGTIESAGDSTLIIIDFNNIEWTINHKDAHIPGAVSVTKGEVVRIMGELSSTNVFYANKILPWGGREKPKER